LNTFTKCPGNRVRYKSRERTAADDEVLRLKALVGNLTMRLELARERARALEAESPFPWRKSRD